MCLQGGEAGSKGIVQGAQIPPFHEIVGIKYTYVICRIGTQYIYGGYQCLRFGTMLETHLDDFCAQTQDFFILLRAKAFRHNNHPVTIPGIVLVKGAFDRRKHQLSTFVSGYQDNKTAGLLCFLERRRSV